MLNRLKMFLAGYGRLSPAEIRDEHATYAGLLIRQHRAAAEYHEGIAQVYEDMLEGLNRPVFEGGKCPTTTQPGVNHG